MPTPPAIAATLSDLLGENERLRLENAELRRLLWALLTGTALRRELHELASAEIQKRWPE